ncbi:hypothetical protein DICPUDRAFT_91957 [Dictyostelium purpureum]|uniref:Carbohydrate binding domain-containing protein n=1 Tax=Dictyostelium purpureum TaxID=5786 RepID=F0ZJT9_DICPU|nr:uncharacterized protein DICPUDRAFT_91957 [Dictyostelium purpureum]EGC35782.1 hypothetical protein DICPUDRAFT_91957 [Dictyostelium purpureum]|eukprot:XP_003287676.1 hypothetical protein DICPUDRAFT_91957 [Dictyostelium purpureum]
MHWKSIYGIGFLVLIAALAVYSSQTGNNYHSLCPAKNKCERVKTWQESGQTLTKFNCYIKNIGRHPLGNVAINLDGAQVKEIWEVESSDKGKTFNFVEWRRSSPLGFGDVHSWGYIVYGKEPLEVNICDQKPKGQFKAVVNAELPQCKLTNECKKANSWVNGNITNTQFECEIKNIGNEPYSFIDIRINDNAALYNVWEIITENYGISWNLVNWRIENSLQPGKTHKWGYIVESDKPLDVQVCQYIDNVVAPQNHTKKIVSEATPSVCFVNNKCTQDNQWKNGEQVNTQYSCKITNNGKVPLSHIDVRLNNNTELYNIWELQTSNYGISFDLPDWRIQNALEPGQSHSWGYIVTDNKELDVKVCQYITEATH